jgi:MOSC domain-containing protein YiiM
MAVTVHHLFISPGHSYFGRHGLPAAPHVMQSPGRVMCRTGCGIEGDRFFSYKPDYKGQITFFAWETYEEIKAALGVPGLQPGAFRRNVLVGGLRLDGLIGRQFRLGGVDFAGTEEAKPCYWMEQAVAPGAEAWLRGRGGLRAKILSDGPLVTGPADFAWLDGALSPGAPG